MFARDKRPHEAEDHRDPPAPPGETPAREADPDETAAMLAQLESERNELNDRYLRAVADYQNVARRAHRDAEEARHQARKAVVLDVLTVLDHFDLALGQDPATATAEQIVGGVRVIRDELMKVLQMHGVELVSAEPNAEFDPNRHQAVVQQAAEGVQPGHIVATLKPGYVLGERVVRPAMVSVAPRE